MTDYTYVIIDDNHGADVVTTDEKRIMDNQGLRHRDVKHWDEDQWDEAARDEVRYSDAAVVMTPDEGRAAALYILENTGGLPPIKKLLERVAALGAAIEEGYPQSIADAWVHHVQPALAAVHEIGEF